MKLAIAIITSILATGVASAQPGADVPPPEAPADPSQPPPPPAMPPPVYAPPPQRFVPVQLTSEEQLLLQSGEISLGAHAGGVVVNWLVGFGLGQAIQGRWDETGWIFTLGEAVTFGALIYGLSQSCLLFCTEEQEDRNREVAPLLIGGLIGYLGFHIWSIADAAIGPAKHNRKVRELRMRLGMPPMAQRLMPYVNKTRDGGGVAGISLRF